MLSQEQKVDERTGLSKAVALIQEKDGWKRIRDLMSPTFSSGKLKQVLKTSAVIFL